MPITMDPEPATEFSAIWVRIHRKWPFRNCLCCQTNSTHDSGNRLFSLPEIRLILEHIRLLKTKMAETEPSDALAQRVIIRFLVFEGVKPAEILRRLTDQFGEQTMKKSRVYAWCARFKDGRESVMDNGRGGSEAKVVNDINISNVEKLILTNKQITVREIAEKTSMSVGSVEKIIHNHLHFRKGTSGWVPKRVKQRQEKA